LFYIINTPDSLGIQYPFSLISAFLSYNCFFQKNTNDYTIQTKVSYIIFL